MEPMLRWRGMILFMGYNYELGIAREEDGAIIVDPEEGLYFEDEVFHIFQKLTNGGTVA
jgi:hypothetical protein